MEKGTCLFLGTGASTGTPKIGCSCPVCLSTDEKNKRLRTSVLLRCGGKNILVDPSPDIRQQALRYGIDRIDGVIITHSHYDHVGGLEELRVYNFLQSGPIECLLKQSSFEDIQKLFFYLFLPPKNGQSYSSQFYFNPLHASEGGVEFCGLPFSYFTYMQGSMPVLGFRLGSFAYVTDIKSYSEDIFPPLYGVKTLVVSALGKGPSSFHLTIDEAVDFASRTGCEKAYFVHVSHEVDYERVSSELKEGMHLSYDGLECIFDI